MDDETGLAVAGSLLLAGAQGIAQRTAYGIDRDLSMYARRRQYWWQEQGRKGTIRTELALGIALGVYVLARRLREARRSPQTIELPGADESASSTSVAG